MSGGDGTPSKRSMLTDLAKITLVIVIGLFLVSLLIPAAGSHRPSDRSICRHNLSQIGMALHDYHNDYGCYPPAYVTDSEGTPIHSWRVLLYPYIIHHKFSAYHFEEPWNSPNNILLLQEDFFRCPKASNEQVGCTNYVAVTGSGTVFDGSLACRDDEISGDPTQIIMLVEIADSDIPWTAPRDLPVETINLKIGADRHGMSSNHANGLNVLYCSGQRVSDGSKSYDCPRAEFLESSISPERLKSKLQFHRNEH